MLGFNLNKICDGRVLSDTWRFYTVNVKYLQTMTHAEFCEEFPESAREIERACRAQEKLAALLEE
jgi:hypothetical protein